MHDHDHSHLHGHGDHSHDVSVDADRYLTIALVLLAVFMAVEVVAGILARSLALLSDAAHMLTDVGAIALSLLVIKFVRRPGGDALTYGRRRAEVLSGQANGAVLLVLGVLVTYESNRADPIASLAVAALMLRSGYQLQRKAIRVLPEGAPEGMPPREIGVALAHGEHVKEVHDLHVWELAPGHPVLTAHVTGLERIVRDNSTYYVIGYVSTNDRREGRFRDVRVRVNRPGLTVRSRNGYLEPQRKAPKPATTTIAPLPSALARAIEQPLANRAVPMDVFATAYRTGDRQATVLIAQERSVEWDERVYGRHAIERQHQRKPRPARGGARERRRTASGQPGDPDSYSLKGQASGLGTVSGLNTRD